MNGFPCPCAARTVPYAVVDCSRAVEIVHGDRDPHIEREYQKSQARFGSEVGNRILNIEALLFDSLCLTCRQPVQNVRACLARQSASSTQVASIEE